MNIFQKRKAIKEGKIIVDHGNNDIRVYQTPVGLVNIKQEGKEHDKEKSNQNHLL